MNKFYYFENEIFKTLSAVKNAAKNYKNKKFEAINTSNNWNTFEAKYEEARAEGNDSTTSLDYATN